MQESAKHMHETCNKYAGDMQVIWNKYSNNMQGYDWIYNKNAINMQINMQIKMHKYAHNMQYICTNIY